MTEQASPSRLDGTYPGSMFGSEPLGVLLLGLIPLLILSALAYWAARPQRRVEDLGWRERWRLDRLDR